MTALLAAAAMTAVAASGILYQADNAVSDQLYQSAKASGGEVIVIGIDQKALDDLGPFQSWSRDVLAMAVEALNEEPEHQPAAIGLDVLFIGETEPDADAYLAEVCGAYDNVVTAAMANFTDDLIINEDGTFYMDDYAIENLELPYEELRAGSVQGHINAMYDTDGILRHSILYLNLPNGERFPSFSYQLYRMYAEHMGAEAIQEPPLDSRGRWYVPYSTMPGGYYEGYSVSDLLAGDVPSDVFEDKIVLIGPYTAGLSDYVLTAIDHAQLMYGVEFQANCIDALIDGEFKKEVNNLWQYALLFAVTLGCMLIFRNRHVVIMTVIWLAGTIGYMGICLYCYSKGYVLHTLWIPLAVTIAYIYFVAVNYIQAALERRRVTGTFKRYVAPEIVNELLKEGADSLSLGGKLTEIAVLFVDIRGFTTMSESLDAVEIVKILNRYLALTSKCVMQNKGTLDKFIGDCTMAIWGAPLPQEDYVYLAAKAALDMIDGEKEISQELMHRFGRKLEFGIGIHCGQAVVGNIGAPDRMDFTAIGDTVNTASRLESNAPGGTIYISRAVADALEDRIITEPLENPLKLKGKTKELEVLKLKGLVNK